MVITLEKCYLYRNPEPTPASGSRTVLSSP